jgi:threonylcarbamoyladenosine tRNA methylthiotransferase MtaB
MFENTRKLVSEAGIQYLHVFPYSEREGTPAARMPQIPMQIRKERAALLRAEGLKELTKFFKQNIGQKVELLVEKNNLAHSESFIPVKLQGEFASGELLHAELISLDDEHMLAKVA